MPFDLSLEKLALILVVSLLVFGPKKTTELAREAGKWVRAARQTWDKYSKELALDELLAEPAPAGPTLPGPRCPACDTEGKAGEVYCGACGAPYENACPACGTRHVSEKTECAVCGTALPEAARRAGRREASETAEERAAAS